MLLTLKFLVAVMNTLDTKTRSSIETAESSFENGEVKSICNCKKRMKTKLSLLSQCIKTKLCKPCTSLTCYLHSSCGMVWYGTLRVNICCNSLSLSLSLWGGGESTCALSLSPTLFHTHTHTRARARARTHTHKRSTKKAANRSLVIHVTLSPPRCQKLRCSCFVWVSFCDYS